MFRRLPALIIAFILECAAATELVSFRFSLTQGYYFSGSTPTSCIPENGGPLLDDCTLGAADAALVARSAEATLAAKLPAMKTGSSPSGTAEELVSVAPFYFVPTFVNHDWFGELSPTLACPSYNITAPEVVLATNNAILGGYFGKCEEFKMIESNGIGQDASQYFHITKEGLLILSLGQFKQKTEYDNIAAVRYAYFSAVSSEQPFIAAVLIADFDNTMDKFADELFSRYSDMKIDAFVAYFGDDANPSYSPRYVAKHNLWIGHATLNGAGWSITTLVELTVPKSGSGAGFGTLMRSFRFMATPSLATRKADPTWMAVQDAVHQSVLRYRAENPVIWEFDSDITMPYADCYAQDCPQGQLIANSYTFALEPGNGAASSTPDSGDGTGGLDYFKLAPQAEIGLGFGGLVWKSSWSSVLRNSTLVNTFMNGRLCRGVLRGLTILRLIRGSIVRTGTTHYLQTHGIRAKFLYPNDTKRRSSPVIVETSIQDPITKKYAPIERTRLYSTTSMELLAQVSPYQDILNEPLRGETLPCAPVQNSWHVLSQVALMTNESSVTTAEPRVVPLDENSTEALASAGTAGLLEPESAAICAGRNEEAGDRALFYDADLLSCAPCPGNLIASADGANCVAPPPPPPPPPPPDRTPVIIAGAASGALAIIAVFVAIVTLLPRWRRRHCPRDAGKPFTVAYVSTLNEGAMRERHPGGVARALRVIERTVAREAGRHGCVVAKRLDAHHMLVSKDPARALQCVTAVLRLLDRQDWGPVLFDSADEERRAQLKVRLVKRRGTTVSTVQSSGTSRRESTASVTTTGFSHTTGGGGGAGGIVAPLVGSGLWHGRGSIEFDESGGEAFGFRYSGGVAICAAGAAMAARAFEVVMPSDTARAAERLLWEAVGPRVDGAHDVEEVLAEFDDDMSLGDGEDSDLENDNTKKSGHAFGAASALSEASLEKGAGPALRVAPPQLGVAVIRRRGIIEGVSAKALADAHPSEHPSARRKTDFASQSRSTVLSVATQSTGLRNTRRGGPATMEVVALGKLRYRPRRKGDRSMSGSESVRGGDGKGNARREDNGSSLAAALSAASGRLAAQRVGVVCVYIPALRGGLRGVSAEASRRLFKSGADPTVAADEIVEAAVGAAESSRLISIVDGCMIFGINTPDVTTAQVPSRATQEAMAIVAAVSEGTGALVSAGVAVGQAFVGQGKQTLGEREGALKARAAPVVVLGTVAERARVLAFVGLRSKLVRQKKDEPKNSGAGAATELVGGDGSEQPSVLVAGDLAAELSSFELQVVDIVAWTDGVTVLQPALPAHGLGPADIRRRVALAVRVVADRTDDADDGDGDGEWLYQVGAVGGQSEFSALNAAVAELVRPLGVVADFASGISVGPDVPDALLSSPAAVWFSELLSIARDDESESRFGIVAKYASRRTGDCLFERPIR